MFRYFDEGGAQPHMFWRPDRIEFSEAARCEILDWCIAEFGPSDFRPSGRWAVTEDINRYYFRAEADAVHFRLRWCGTLV